MKKSINLKAILMTLCCMIGLGASAQSLQPESGKCYRIKNLRAGKYLTMSSSSKTSVVMSDLLNSEYQFWTLTEYDSPASWTLNNTGWLNSSTDTDGNPNGKAFLRASGTSQNSSVVAGASSTTASNARFLFEEGTYNSTACYSIVLRGSTMGVNCNPSGGNPVLYGKTDDGSYWVLEEATIVLPEIITIKNNRSKKFMSENAQGKIVQVASGTAETSRWIKYPVDGGIMLINSSTHDILQPVAKNADAVAGPDWAVYQTVTDGTYVAFGTMQGKEMIYLNDKGQAGTTVAGWTGALDDAGNKWIVSHVGDITEEEIIAMLRNKSPYATAIEDGKLYRIYNETRDNYLYDNFIFGTANGAGLNENDYVQLWRAEKSGSSFKLKSIVSDRYIQAGSGQSVKATMTATGTAFNVVANTSKSTIYTYFNFTNGSYALHMDSSAQLVNWYTSSTSVDASDWLLVEVDETLLDAERLAQQRADYQTYADSQAAFDALYNNRLAYEKVLKTLFSDMAMTELKDEAKAMTDDEFKAAIAGLPDFLQEMCLKIKNDTWTLSKAGNNWEKFFRIADYKVYSQANSICWEIGMSNPFSRLSNPTGISGDAGDVITIFVNDNCPSNANLMVEFTDGGEKDNPRTGDQYTLRRGINMFMLQRSKDIFIYYEINGSGNSQTYYLSKFKDIKIHIEGGKCNGYYDQTRDMNDEQWADMVNSDMLRHGRVFLKGTHVVGNWPSSILLANNPKTIDDICTFYNQIPKWEQEIMGVNDHYLPNIEKRYRNVLTALGTDLGNAYMYATSFGTYYNWGTLNDILSKNVLSNGGNQWGPAHEFGHNHQNLFNMVGCTEVSNNVFSNAVIYKMGAAMSRGVALSELIPAYAKRQNWMMLGIWCKTQMYWKLYQYFHLAGYDTEFFPKVFSIMRTNGLKHQNGQLVPASTDYLRFAEVCCEAANADLSEFFQMYGFFDPVQNDTEKDGVACQYIDDYSTYYLYSTPAMIEKTLKYCHSFEKKILNIGFIDDRIRATPATYPGAPAGKMRTGMNGGGDNSVGTEGTIGMYLDYYPENYVPVTQYEASTLRNNSNGTISVTIRQASGKGAMGFKVYSPSGELMYFYNDFKFTIPDLRSIYGDYDRSNIVIMAADAQGNDVAVHNKWYYLDSVDEAKADARRPDVIYDLQGRRLMDAQHGLFIVNGKKIVR